MLNRSGIRRTTLTAPVQILANVELQSSVGCRVPQSLSADDGAKKIVKAGTPIHIDLTDLQTEVKEVKDTDNLNAVLLHDVDVSEGTANGTALIFGFVNLNRVTESVKEDIEAALEVGTPSVLLTFMSA